MPAYPNKSSVYFLPVRSDLTVSLYCRLVILLSCKVVEQTSPQLPAHAFRFAAAFAGLLIFTVAQQKLS